MACSVWGLCGCAASAIRSATEQPVESKLVIELDEVPEGVSGGEHAPLSESHATFVDPSTQVPEACYFTHSSVVLIESAFIDPFVASTPERSGKMAGVWFRTSDLGVSWIPCAPPEQLAGRTRFRFEQDGRYGFRYVPLSDGPIRGMLTPSGGTPAQFLVVVDTKAPVLDWLGQKVEDHGRTLVLRWSAQDANLGERPVQIEYQIYDQAEWVPIAEPLSNTGLYKWDLPPEEARAMRFRITVRDLAGLAGRWITPLVEIRVLGLSDELTSEK